jgi:hypothetical protein
MYATCLAGINHAVFLMYDFLCIVWFSLLIFCWGSLHLYLWEILVCHFYSCNVLGWFNIRVMLASEWIRKYTLASVFWKRWLRIQIISLLSVWYNLTVNSYQSSAFCLGKLLILDSISFLGMGLFKSCFVLNEFC